jgi:hypothetical protein
MIPEKVRKSQKNRKKSEKKEKVRKCPKLGVDGDGVNIVTNKLPRKNGMWDKEFNLV